MAQPPYKKHLSILLILTVYLPVLYAQISTKPQASACSFQNFMQMYHKIYDSTQQLEKRKSIYLQNCQYVSQHNLNPTASFTLATDQYSDLTSQELKNLRGIAPLPQKQASKTELRVSAPSLTTQATPIPLTLDYRVMGLLSSDDKALSFCNSSWAIAAAYVYESKLLSLFTYNYTSEYAVTQCAGLYATVNRASDCSGGYFEDALLFLSLVGTVSKGLYPNASYNFAANPSNAAVCTQNNRIFIGEGTPVIVQNASIDQIKRLLVQKGPLVVTLFANKEFLLYSSGLFNSCPQNLSDSANLAVVLFGYQGNDYWLIRAPLGEKWGYLGAMRLSMSNNCGLNNRIGYIEYSSVNSNVSQVFDPTKKFNRKFQNPKTNQQRILTYCLSLSLLALLLGFGL